MATVLPYLSKVQKKRERQSHHQDLLVAGLTITGSGQGPDVSIATTDITAEGSSILQLTRQLNSFRKKNLLLGRFRMLGHTERRSGGMELKPWFT
jgi:hypothetical protein